MPTDFTLPELGENITAGDVVRVLVSAGDAVAKDQPVLELETDKATIEVPSSVAGTVKDVRVKQGERIKVGQVVLTVDEGAARGAKPEAAGKPVADGRSGGAKPQPPGAAVEGGLSQKAPGQQEAASSGGAKRAAEEDRDEGRAEQPEAQQADSVRRLEAEARRSRGHQPWRARDPRGGRVRGGGRIRAPPAPAAPSVRRLRARAWRGYPPRARAAVLAAASAMRTCRLSCATRCRRRRRHTGAKCAPRLHEVGRGRTQADEQHPPEDGGAPEPTPGTRFRTSRSTTRRTSPPSRSCARSMRRRRRRRAASSR